MNHMMPPLHILLVEEDSGFRTQIFRLLEKKKYQVVTAANAREALVFLQQNTLFDLMILNLNLSEVQFSDGRLTLGPAAEQVGLDLMKKFRHLQPSMQFITMSSAPSVSTAVQIFQEGGLQYLTKPFDGNEIIPLIEKNFEKSEHQSQKKFARSSIIGQSPSLQEVMILVEKVAQSESTILITGESGTGKELIARSIHANSRRSNNPFVAINCGAIPSELLESELFGHVKGAFTGAIINRVGRFEMADGGTLFLDEIGDLHPTLQVKLLRVLQEKTFEPVGGTKSLASNVRLIAATNKNLEEAVSKGSFREDLFYRLNVIPIHVPPLRQRGTDVPALLQHFLSQHNGQTSGRKVLGFSAECIDCLCQYSWPGNIRELENLVERLAILKGFGEIDIHDLPIKYRSIGPFMGSSLGAPSGQTYKTHSSLPSGLTAVGPEGTTPLSPEIPEAGMDFNSVVDRFENDLILRALEKTGWNRNQAALLLRLNRTTLVEKIKKKGLKPPSDVYSDISQ